MSKRLREYPPVLVLAAALFLTAYTLAYLQFPFGPPWLFCLQLTAWQAAPWGVFLGVIWLMRKAFGAERANPWLLGITILLIAFAVYTYAPALRPFDPEHPEFEPNIVFLISPINVLIVTAFLTVPVALICAARRVFDRKDRDLR
jgi:hypothetical protein